MTTPSPPNNSKKRRSRASTTERERELIKKARIKERIRIEKQIQKQNQEGTIKRTKIPQSLVPTIWVMHTHMGLTYRQISDLLWKAYSINVSHVAVHYRVKQFKSLVHTSMSQQAIEEVISAITEGLTNENLPT